MLIQSFFKLGSFQTCFHCTDAKIVSNCFFLDTRIRVSVWLISSVGLDSGLVRLPQALLALHTYSEVWLVWGLSLANLGSSKCCLCSAFRIGIFHCFCIEASHTYLIDFLFSCDYRIQLPPQSS